MTLRSVVTYDPIDHNERYEYQFQFEEVRQIQKKERKNCKLKLTVNFLVHFAEAEN